MPRTPIRRFAPILVALLAVTGSCVDGPFERVNPNDEQLEFTMQLVSDRDTLSPANPIVVFQVVTDPVFTGYAPQWAVTSGSGILHRGNDVYELTTTPTSLTTVEVSATYFGRSASRTIFRAPTP